MRNIYLVCEENLKKYIEKEVECRKIIKHDVYFNLRNIVEVIDKVDIIYIQNNIFYEKELLEELVRKEGIVYKTLPTINELLGSITYSQLDNLTYENVFEKKSKNILNDYNNLENLEGKVVMIAGAAGTIGSGIVRELINHNIEKMILVDINENTLYFLELFLRGNFHTNIEVIIGNIQNYDRMNEIFKRFKPDVLFHAAASKHVPLCEINPTEAIKNNVIGTYNLFILAEHYKIERAIFISTDKAVNPPNVMGATKRLAEMLISNIKFTKTKVGIVRFGNVWGSEGSLLHIIKNRIKANQSLTLTHKEVTRYFMSIEEAVQLVIVSSLIVDEIKLYVLDMGNPVKIYDVLVRIKNMIGINNDIEIIGLRSGEKLYEELSYNLDFIEKTKNDKIMILDKELDVKFNAKELIKKYEKIITFGTKEECINALKNDVETYSPK